MTDEEMQTFLLHEVAGMYDQRDEIDKRAAAQSVADRLIVLLVTVEELRHVIRTMEEMR